MTSEIKMSSSNTGLAKVTIKHSTYLTYTLTECSVPIGMSTAQEPSIDRECLDSVISKFPQDIDF